MPDDLQQLTDRALYRRLRKVTLALRRDQENAALAAEKERLLREYGKRLRPVELDQGVWEF